MKKLLKTLLLLIFIVMVNGCTSKNYETKIGTMNDLSKVISEAKASWGHPFFKTSISFENGVSETYNLYDTIKVNAINYKDYDEVLSLEINYKEQIINNLIFNLSFKKNLSETTYNYTKNFLKNALSEIFKDLDDKTINNILDELNYPIYKNFKKNKFKKKNKEIIINERNKIISEFESDKFKISFSNL
ncbi:MAG: hypothetical protein IJB82_00490 [Bacilli bacterium]|nr:hypothetical protein [Bacilli bacterium]